MIALNEILIRRVSKNDTQKVNDLLQEISVYNPPKKVRKYLGKVFKPTNFFWILFFSMINLLDMEL